MWRIVDVLAMWRFVPHIDNDGREILLEDLRNLLNRERRSSKWSISGRSLAGATKLLQFVIHTIEAWILRNMFWSKSDANIWKQAERYPIPVARGRHLGSYTRTLYEIKDVGVLDEPLLREIVDKYRYPFFPQKYMIHIPA